MVRFLAQIVLTLLVCVPSYAAGDPKCCVPVKLDVHPQWTSKGRLELAITLTNTGEKPLRFSKGSGPWVGPEQIRLVAIILPWGDPIVNKEQALRDPHLGSMELAPGEAEQHSVAIDDIYPELAAELRNGKSDVVLFWTYQLMTSDSAQSERVGGWLMFPAKRTGSNDVKSVR